jgi:hypothetical protein
LELWERFRSTCFFRNLGRTPMVPIHGGWFCLTNLQSTY